MVCICVFLCICSSLLKSTQGQEMAVGEQRIIPSFFTIYAGYFEDMSLAFVYYILVTLSLQRWSLQFIILFFIY